MSANLTNEHRQRWRVLRTLPWIAAAILLLLPVVAMRFTSEVAWTASDFMVMGGMLLFACGSFELVARKAPNVTYLAAATIAIGTGFLLVWANLAVGIIGPESNGANLMFFGVLVIAIAGALVARSRPRAMAIAMAVTAVALMLAIATGLLLFQASAREAVLTMVFAVAWLVSAALFRKSARG